MNRQSVWPASVVALGFLALVGLLFWRATENMGNFDTIWAVAGPIVGIVVGAIPGFFFAQSARRDQKEAHMRAEAYAAALPEEQRPAAIEMLQRIKGTVRP